jgi:hypothetical protein
MKLTTKRLRYLIKEELKKVLSETYDVDQEMEREISDMFDAGKQAAVEDGNDIRTAIRLAGEYALESARIKEVFPNAHAWLLSADQYAADEELENWMANKKYSMR